MLCLLGREEGLFALDPPAITGEFATLAHNAMARDDDGDRIGGAGASHGAHGSGIANAACDFGIGSSLSVRNALKLFPDAALECSAANVEGNLATLGAGTQPRNHSTSPGTDAVRVFTEFRVREIMGQLVEKPGIGLTEHDRAHAARSGADQQATERRIHNGVANFEPRCAAVVVTRRHAKVSVGTFVETARGTVACLVDGCGHISPVPQTALEAAQTNGVGILPGRDSQHAAKQAQQTKRPETGLTREGLESGAARIARGCGFTRFDGVFDSTAETVDQRAFRGAERDIASQATGAGAITPPQRICWSWKKGDVARRGTARGAARPAENPRAANGENEAAVEGGIACGHGAPPGAVRSADPLLTRQQPAARYSR